MQRQQVASRRSRKRPRACRRRTARGARAAMAREVGVGERGQQVVGGGDEAGGAGLRAGRHSRRRNSRCRGRAGWREPRLAGSHGLWPLGRRRRCRRSATTGQSRYQRPISPKVSAIQTASRGRGRRLRSGARRRRPAARAAAAISAPRAGRRGARISSAAGSAAKRRAARQGHGLVLGVGRGGAPEAAARRARRERRPGPGSSASGGAAALSEPVTRTSPGRQGRADARRWRRPARRSGRSGRRDRRRGRARARGGGKGVGVHPGVDQRQRDAARVACPPRAPGQRSCSAQTDRSGRQWSRKRRR